MKIGVINNLYEPFARGGAEKICEKLVNGFKAAGDNVFVVSTRPYFGRVENDENFNKYYIRSLYLSLSRIPKILRLSWHCFDLFDVRVFFQVFCILKKEKPDFVVLNNLKGLSYLIPFLLKIMRVKHVVLLHDIQLIHPSGLMILGDEFIIDSLFSRIYRGINKVLFSRVDFVVSPSEWLLDLYISRGFFKDSLKKVVPNPVNLCYCASGEKRRKFSFLFVGQIEEHKGLNVLLQAFNEFADWCEDEVDLIIIGDGVDFDKLSSSWENSNIIFLGKKSEKEVLEAMSSTHCLVVPSVCYENSPTVIFEAMSCGARVLASRIGGIPEIINKYGGYLFDPGNIADLNTKMKKVFCDNNNSKSVNLNVLSDEFYIDKLRSLIR